MTCSGEESQGCMYKGCLMTTEFGGNLASNSDGNPKLNQCCNDNNRYVLSHVSCNKMWSYTTLSQCEKGGFYPILST